MSSKPSFPIQRKTPTAQWLLALGLLLVSATATAQAPQARQAPRVTVMTVGAQAVGAGLEMDGCLQAVRQTVLSALASGRIAQLSVKAGDQVKAGQVLAVIDDRATEAGVAQAQAGVAQADARLVNAKAQFERTRDLRAQGFVAQAALDTA
jgi:multidrug efflux pump subunit AcrA (membrane-fusion protein)